MDNLKDLKRALQKSNTMLEIMKNILNQLDSMVYVSDPRTDVILFVNDRMKQHFGLEGGIGEVCYEVFQEGLNERCKFCPCSQLDIAPDAVIVWEEHSSLTNRIYQNTDRYIDWIGDRKVHIRSCFDITDLRHTQDVLEYQEKLTEGLNKAAITLLSQGEKTFEDALDIGMFPIADTVGISRIVIYCYMKGDLQQLYCWDLESGGLIPTSVLPQEPPNKDLIKILSVGQSINHQSIYMSPILVQGGFWGVVTFQDRLNERIFSEAETELLNSAAHLFANAIMQYKMEQDLAKERDLHDKQIRAALDQATSASKAKGDFLSNMSHEMRTPLNAIIGMTAIGKKEENIDGKNRALIKIGDASTHLLGVINDILDMAKIEANKMELSDIEYDFKKMLDKVLTFIRFRSDEKKQSLTQSIDESIPRFLIGDEQRLAQVITNILANAVKFTPEGGEVHLEVILVEETVESHTLRIEVTDSGIGIAPEKQEKLFQAFEQAESGISREFGGTGLGLVISRRIVEHMGGRIWIESKLGHGAKFIFTIQAKRSERSEDDTEDGTESDNFDSMADDTDLHGKKLLVAEDIEINREILLSLLDGFGLIIDCAENGKDALQMVEADPSKYDIVFMDIQMPGMDGLEATRRIRALPGHNREKLPIIAMTANVFKSDIEECLAAGMDDHLGKPLDMDKVIEKLRMYLSSAAKIK